MSARSSRWAILFAGAILLTGCAAAPNAADPETAAVGAPVMETPATATTESGTTESEAETTGAYVEYTDGAIESTPGTKALFFHAPWCPQCRALDDDLRATGVPDGLTVFKVDYDSRTDLRQKYGVTLQTTVVFVDDAGEALSSQVLYDDPSVASLTAAIP